MSGASKSSQLPFAFPMKRSFAREDFVPGTSNEAALAFVDGWPQWPARVCALWGPSGSGKTHLSQIWKSTADAVEIAPTDLTSDRVAELAASAHILIDEVGQNDNGAGLFHLINFINQTSGWLLLTGEQAPQRWPTAIPDLHSRLTAIPGVSLELPDEALMARVLLKLSGDRQLKFPEALIDYLVPRLRRSFVDAERLVILMDFLALENKRGPSIETAARALRQMDEERGGQSADNLDELG